MRNATQPFKILLSTVSMLAMVLTGCNEHNAEYPPRKMPAGLDTNAERITLGQTLFSNKCANCHGKPSEGRSDRAAFFSPPAPDFTDRHYKKIDPAYLYWRIETGKNVEPYRSKGSVMPAWGAHFSEDQIWQIIAYLRFRAH